jgi:S-adenosylmethionine hydrolase
MKIAAVVELRAERYRLPRISATFHGRDIFAPACAWLWRGVPLPELGPPLETVVQLEPAAVSEGPNQLRGQIIYIDGFGNLITNISRESFQRFAGRFQPDSLSIRIKARAALELRNAYAEVGLGVPLAIFGSFDLLEIAIRDGNAATRFGAVPGTPVWLEPNRARPGNARRQSTRGRS